MNNRTKTGTFARGTSGNPKGRPRKDSGADAVERATIDGWTSLLTGIGNPLRDKRLQTTFAADILSDGEAMELWRGDDLAARAVELWPSEMLREGWELCVAEENEKQRGEQITKRCEELQLNERLKEALQYCRAYGGGAVLLGVNDGQEPDKPLNSKTVRSVDWLTSLEPRELVPLYYYANPLAPKFGEVEVWQLNPNINGQSRNFEVPKQGTLIHESRLIVFNGIKVTRMQIGTRAYWGDGVLGRVNRVLRDFNAALDAAGILMTDFSQAVWKIDDLAALVNSSNSTALRTRMQAMEMSRSVLQAIVIGRDEEFGRTTTNVTGLPELIDRFATRLCAAFDAPLTLIFGQSPGGLNATGASDIRFFYDRVAGKQTTQLLPALKRFVSLMFAATGGEPKTWSIEFKPLWQESAKEQAESRSIQAQSDASYIDRQVLTPEEVRASRFGGDAYSFETQTDIEGDDLDSDLEALDPGDPELRNRSLIAELGNKPEDGGSSPPGSAPIPGVPTTTAVVGTDVQKQAMNGAQVSALVELLKVVVAGELSRESGAAVLEACFPVNSEQAQQMLGPKDFKPTKPDPVLPVGPIGNNLSAPGAVAPKEPNP